MEDKKKTQENFNKYLIKKQGEKTKKDEKIPIEIITADQLPAIEFIPTGNPLLDARIGGIPRGRYTILYGGPGVSKSTEVLRWIAHWQKLGLVVFLNDAEQGSDPAWMKKQGVESTLSMSRSTDLQNVLDTIQRIAKSGKADVIVVDSLAALSAKEKRAKGVGHDYMTLEARRLSVFFVAATEYVARTGTAIVFITQVRQDPMNMFSGSLEQYSGGNALKHNLSLGLHLRRKSTKKIPRGERFLKNTQKIGFLTHWTVVKTKIGIIEGMSFDTDFFFGKGPDYTNSVVEFALNNSIITRKGAVYSIDMPDGKEHKSLGLETLKHDIMSNGSLYNTIIGKIRRIDDSQLIAPLDPSDIDTAYEEGAIEKEKEAIHKKETKGKTKTKPKKKTGEKGEPTV